MTRRPRRWTRVVAALVSVAVIAVTALLSLGVLVAGKLSSNMTSINLADMLQGRPEKAAGNGPYEPLSILLMGSDTRVDQGSGFGAVENYGPPRSDTAILLHISADRKHALAVSLPRDSWVALPECTSQDGSTTHPATEGKLNSAFERGGPACTVKTVEALTGVYVDHFAVVDFKGFQQVIDAMGGVEVCLPTAVNDPKSHLELPAGVSVVTGKQALAFVRARKTIGDGSDIGRISRQQQFLSSAIRKATSLGVLANPVTLYSMLDAASSAVTVDSGLSGVDQMKNLALSVQGLSPKNIVFTTVPFADRGDGENVVWTAGARPLWESMRHDTSWPPAATPGRDGKALVTIPGDVRVHVYNASGVSGAAKTFAARLTDDGFAVKGMDTAPKKLATSVIQYDPKFDQSARTLAAALPGVKAVPVEGLGHTLLVFIGTDAPKVTAVYVKPPKNSNPLDNPNVATPRTADQKICG